MNKVAIVVLSKYQDIFDGFCDNLLAAGISQEVPRILVRDGHELSTQRLTPHWIVIQGPPKFSMAGNANLGWRCAARFGFDVLYCGDDVRFTGPTVAIMRELAYSDSRLGILSPRIHGGANNLLQLKPGAIDLVYVHKLCFPCVYIKRELIERIGYLDESLTPTPDSYGFDDDDYCRRAQLSGFRLAVTGRVAVEHPAQAMSTFRRNHAGDVAPVQAAMAEGRARYERKWNQAAGGSGQQPSASCVPPPAR